MYQEFSVLGFQCNLISKEIIIETNQTLNPNTLDETTIELIERTSKSHVSFKREVRDKNLVLTLYDWPVPNSVYTLYIKNLKNILNESIASSYSRKLMFDSTITDTVTITSPGMYEEIKKLNIAFNINSKDKKIKPVFIEIAKDNIFCNVVKSSTVFQKNEITIGGLDSGQYYLRARVQNEEEGNKFEYGIWSDVISFIYGKEEPKESEKEEDLSYLPDYEDLTPIIDDTPDYEIKLITPNGVSTNKFAFESNKPLDENNFDRSQIVIYGKEGILETNIVVVDCLIDITLKEKIKDNSTYTIKLMNIKNIFKETYSETIKFNSAMKPFYCDVEAVKALIGDDNISDSVIMYHIREASKYADYVIASAKKVYEITDDNVPFVIEQFVKYYAAHECLLRHSIDLASSVGLKGVVGNVQFEDKETNRDITKLLDHFCKEIDKWKDAIKGYDNEGRAKMKSTIRGKNSNPQIQPIGLPTMNSYGRGDL